MAIWLMLSMSGNKVSIVAKRHSCLLKNLLTGYSLCTLADPILEAVQTLETIKLYKECYGVLGSPKRAAVPVWFIK
jgi:hypothetical protein